MSTENKAKQGTKIHTESDFAVTALVMAIDGELRMKLACDMLGKDPSAYAHLDKGRRSMTGANLLRGAARRGEINADQVKTAILDLRVGAADIKSDAQYAKQVLDEDGETMGEFVIDMSAAAANNLVWPNSARFKFATKQEDGSFKFFYNAPKSGDYFTR
jgi:hypothetical protein